MYKFVQVEASAIFYKNKPNKDYHFPYHLEQTHEQLSGFASDETEFDTSNFAVPKQLSHGQVTDSRCEGRRAAQRCWTLPPHQPPEDHIHLGTQKRELRD